VHNDIIKPNYKHRRAYKGLLQADRDILNTTFLFASLSNPQKHDPMTFQVWMNVLRSFGGSKLAFMEYSTSKYAMKNLRKFARSLGVSSNRIVNVAQENWIDHIFTKTAFDLLLDTSAKNGHTTSLDGVWAGVPTVALGGGSSMPKRASESIFSSLGNRSSIGITYSLKEYEDLIFNYTQKTKNNVRSLPKGKLKQICESIIESDADDDSIEYCIEVAMSERNRLSGKEKLEIWRSHVEAQRADSALFDTKSFTKRFTHLLQAIWELHYLSNRKSNKKMKAKRKYHIFPSNIPNQNIDFAHIIEQEIQNRQQISYKQATPAHAAKKVKLKIGNIIPKIKAIDPNDYPPLPANFYDGKMIMLNIGRYAINCLN